jgi:fucose permease
MLVNAFVAAVPGVLVGASVKRTGRYRLQMWLAWVLMVIGMALLVTVNEHRASRFMLGYLIIASTGVTILTSTTYFPVLAPCEFSLMCEDTVR